MDRFDLHVDVPPVSYTDLEAPQSSETSAKVGERVALARGRQSARYSTSPEVRTNADVDGADTVRKSHVAEAVSFRMPMN